MVVTVVVLELLIFAAVMMSQPIYSLVQEQREEILACCGTYTQDILQGQIGYFDQAARDLDQNMQNQSQDAQYAIAKKLRKKKAISVTSRLERHNIKLLLMALVLFVVISVYPIVNFVVTLDFVNE